MHVLFWTCPHTDYLVLTELKKFCDVDLHANKFYQCFCAFLFFFLAESVFGCLHTMLGLVCKQLDFRFNTLSTVGLSQDGLYWSDELTIIKFMIDQGLGAIHHKNKNSDKVLYCFALAHIPLSSLD